MLRVVLVVFVALLSSLASVVASEPWGLFYNATQYEIVVDFYRAHGSIWATMYVGPNGCNEVNLMQGTAVVHALRGKGPVWRRRYGKELARVVLIIPNTHSQTAFSWRHPQYREAYCRISRGKVALLSPAEGKRLCP